MPRSSVWASLLLLASTLAGCYSTGPVGTPHSMTAADVEQCKGQALSATTWLDNLSQTTRDAGLGTATADLEAARQELVTAIKTFQDSTIGNPNRPSLGNVFCMVPWSGFLAALESGREQLSHPASSDDFVAIWRQINEAAKHFSDVVDTMAVP